MNFITYCLTNYNDILSLFLEHIALTLFAVLFAIVIGVPLGILITYIKPLGKPVIGFANLVQAIPSMALLGLTIPILGIGTEPAVFLVVIYSLLPIIKNTYTGLVNINDQVLEAASGIGLSKMQILFKVQIPLALPVIMTGVRISAVSAVGLMTLAAFVGGGGLGDLVFAGIRTVDNTKILAGAIPACILALLVDRIADAIETLVTPISLLPGGREKQTKRKKSQKRFLGNSALLLAVLIGFYGVVTVTAKKTDLILGSMDFTESELFCYMIEEVAEDRMDIEVESKVDLGGSSICFSSIKADEIDGYVEYTGTAYVNILGHEAISDVDQVFRTVQEEYMEKFGIAVLDSLNVNNTYTLSTTKEIAEKYGLKTISDLKQYNGQLRSVTTLMFLNRVDGLEGVKQAYGLTFKDETGVDGSARYTALLSGECDLIDAYSTDGLLKKFDLVKLEDDKGFFPPYYAVPMFNEEVIQKYPGLVDVCAEIGAVLNDDIMAELNYRVDELGEKPADVVHKFLVENGLIQ